VKRFYKNKLLIIPLLLLIVFGTVSFSIIKLLNNYNLDQYLEAKSTGNLILSSEYLIKIPWYSDYENEKYSLIEELKREAYKLYNNYFYEEALVYLNNALELDYSDELNSEISQINEERNKPQIIIEGQPIFTSYTPQLGTGNPVRIFLYNPHTPAEIKINLISENNEKISTAEPFYMNDIFSINAYYCIIGIPQITEEGLYFFEIYFNADNIMQIPVNIIKNEAAYEYIYINDQLGEILNLKKESAGEMQELSALLKKQNTNIFETEKFIKPIENVPVTSGFGDKRIFIYPDGNETVDYHSGIDYGAVTGTPIFAIGAGKVILTDEYVITGKTLIIEHFPGLYSLYCHLSEILINKDQLVNKGDTICIVGNTGLSTAAHLHLSVYVFGIPVNPEFFFGNDLILIQ
jgi:murein DD-endopeptidase MepM/ murein hydrolase activator NlpD